MMIKKIYFYILLTVGSVQAFNWEFYKSLIGFKILFSKHSEIIGNSHGERYGTKYPANIWNMKYVGVKCSEMLFLPIVNVWTFIRTRYIFATWKYYEEQKKDIEKMYAESQKKREIIVNDIVQLHEGYAQDIEQKINKLKHDTENISNEEQKQRLTILDQINCFMAVTNMQQIQLKKLDTQINNNTYNRSLNELNHKLTLIKSILINDRQQPIREVPVCILSKEL